MPPPEIIQANLLHIYQHGSLTVPKKGFWASRYRGWVELEEAGAKKTMWRLTLSPEGNAWCEKQQNRYRHAIPDNFWQGGTGKLYVIPITGYRKLSLQEAQEVTGLEK